MLRGIWRKRNDTENVKLGVGIEIGVRGCFIQYGIGNLY